MSFSIKLINPRQKHQHIIESIACILKILVMMFLLLMNFQISFGVYSTLKLLRYVTLSPFSYKAIQWVPTDSYLSRFVTYIPSFVLDKLFLEYKSIKFRLVIKIFLYLKIN